MFNNLKYKEKLKGLAIFAFLLIVLTYKLSISATVEEYQTYKKKSADLAIEKTANYDFSGEQTKHNRIKANLKKYMLDSLDNSKNLLSIVSSYCEKNNLELKEYKPIGQKTYDSLQLLIRVVTVEGPFAECVKLNFNLERESNCGRIGSVLYKSYFNTKDKTTSLNCSFFILNLLDYENKK